MACMVASGSPAPNSVMTITRCRRSSSSRCRRYSAHCSARCFLAICTNPVIKIDHYQSGVIAQSPWRATAGMSGWDLRHHGEEQEYCEDYQVNEALEHGSSAGAQLPLRRHPDTSVEYDGDNPLRLAEEIDAALDKYGLGNNRRIFTGIFEGELRLIADCLRCTGSQKGRKALTEWPHGKKWRNMTMTNASSSARGRRVKFTPQAIEKIK